MAQRTFIALLLKRNSGRPGPESLERKNGYSVERHSHRGPQRRNRGRSARNVGIRTWRSTWKPCVAACVDGQDQGRYADGAGAMAMQLLRASLGRLRCPYI